MYTGRKEKGKLFFFFLKESTFLEEKRKLGELKASGSRGAFFFFSSNIGLCYHHKA